MALGLLVMMVSAFAPVVFVASQCYGDGFQPAMRRPPAARDIPNYTRDEAYTFWALPQWIVIYSTDAYARHIAASPPSEFPYFSAIGQFWRHYGGVCGVTQNRYAFDTDYHTMVGVVGLGFSVESALKGLYENTVGWITERFGSTDTAEDRFAARVASEYGTFMHTEPWYEYPFADQLVTLWTSTPLVGSNPIRKWERRLFLTAELGVKTVYASVVGLAQAVAYAAENPQIHVWIERAPESIFADADIVRVAVVGPQAYIVRLPRYEPFTKMLLSMHASGVRFVSIAGNDDILITVIKTREHGAPPSPARVLSDEPLLNEPAHSRLAVALPVAALNDTIAYVQANEGIIEHIYDY
jgi:hypothetical protein